MKRVRSKRIENDKKLAVLFETDIDMAMLQEYSGCLFATGVEKEEEEEHHLKAVITGAGEAIPTPKATHKAGSARANKKRSAVPASGTGSEEKPEGYLSDTGDVPNAYVLSAADKEFLARAEDKNQEKDGPMSKELEEYFQRKEIATLDSSLPSQLLPYVCFRKRETKALRKARKPDTSIEKIKRIKVDLQMIRRLAELCSQRDAYLIYHLNTILSIFSICREMNKRLDIGVLSISETILRDILFTKLISKSDKFYKKIPSFTNLYTCRKSIGSLRKLIRNGPAPEEAVNLSAEELECLQAYSEGKRPRAPCKSK